MASLVAEVLQSKEPLDKASLKALVAKLAYQIDKLKSDLQKELVSKYDIFEQYHAHSSYLTTCLEAAVSEVDDVQKKVRDHVKPRLRQATTEFKQLSEELTVVEEQSVEVMKYVKIHECFEKAEEAFSAHKLEWCSKQLEEAGDVIGTLAGKADIQLVDALHTEHVIKCERLQYNLTEEWNKRFVWKIGKAPHIVVLTVQVTSVEDTNATIRALESQNDLGHKVSQFGRSLLTNVVEPMVKYSSKVTLEPGSSTMQVDFAEHGVPGITAVLQNLSTVFTFLNNSLMGLCAGEKSMLQLIGEAVGRDFADVVVKCCLEPAVPSDGSQLGAFPTEELLDFHNQLIGIHFLSAGASQFSSFTTDLESLCINKRSQNILMKARELMKQPLHETSVVGVVGVAEKQKLKSIEDGLDGSIFMFPKSQVSKHSVEVVDLMKSLVSEAKDGQADRVWYMNTVRNICELYCGVVPVIHKHAIETIPQQTAIHHNNCMYLAHELLELAASMTGVTIVDLALKLRKLGVTPFLDQMKKQREHLLDFLRDVSSYEDSGAIERAVQRCLYHLQQLKKVWSDVLPVPVYLKAIGTLLNSVVEHITTSIVDMEDISSTLSEDLMATLDRMITQATELFDVADSPQDERVAASNHVQKWKKVCELKSLLGYNLRQVVDRWADGKGPLAVCFTSEEVKKLVRALFQNTDRRAAALAKIR
uniref:Putative centromere/kinetochore protein zw10 involved in mitotic chromosome segregation n=1 Tax=Ornithodoros turicata TaxID=34597 RepID=A0A2R5L8Y8_9ACAR